METKQEFIDGLRRVLTGKISQTEVEEHIRYYDDYITAETRKTGNEKVVLDALGKPSLIAMSICAADAAGERREGGYTSAQDTYTSDKEGGYYETNERYADSDASKASDDGRPFIFRHPKLTIGLVISGIVVLVVLFIGVVFSILKFLWPVIVVVVSVVLLVRLVAFLRDNM